MNHYDECEDNRPKVQKQSYNLDWLTKPSNSQDDYEFHRQQRIYFCKRVRKIRRANP